MKMNDKRETKIPRKFGTKGRRGIKNGTLQWAWQTDTPRSFSAEELIRMRSDFRRGLFTVEQNEMELQLGEMEEGLEDGGSSNVSKHQS